MNKKCTVPFSKPRTIPGKCWKTSFCRSILSDEVPERFIYPNHPQCRTVKIVRHESEIKIETERRRSNNNFDQGEFSRSSNTTLPEINETNSNSISTWIKIVLDWLAFLTHIGISPFT